jgi:hypothetical protein
VFGALSVLLAGSAAQAQDATTPASTPSVCSAEISAQQASSDTYGNALGQFNEKNPPNASKPAACVRGTLSWELKSWKMDLPEVTMRRKEWKMDVPETWLGQQEWWVKEPIVKCENRKVGQYPQTRCEDTWVHVGPIKTKGIPNCTVTWHDIITKVCWPETRDKKIVLGVPEFKMTTRVFSMDLPEVTMKTRELSLHLPRFDAESGCLGAECADKCNAALNSQMDDLSRRRTEATTPAKQALLATTTAMFQCQQTAIGAQRDEALAQYDRYIAVAEKTLAEMRAQGLDKVASEQESSLSSMKLEREAVRSDLDGVLDGLRKQEQEVMSALGS